MRKSEIEQFSKEEADSRFKAALRGARLAESRPMKSIVKKQPNTPSSAKRRPKR